MEVSSMGTLNLLKGAYTGKVGATVGSKWKNKSTVRTYSKPSNPDTPAQQQTRNGFKALSSFVVLFADLIKRLTALDTRGMSVRNAILKINSDQIADGELVAEDLIVSKGGLPLVHGFAGTVAAGLANATFSWDEAVASTISNKAVVVVIVVDNTNKRAFVGSALNTAETLTIPGPYAKSIGHDVYYYLLDFRGSSKVASASGYKFVSSPAA
jgi:hypothetical protein